MEFIFQLLAELLLQLFGEVLIEIGLRALVAPFRKESPPWLAAVGYFILGSAIGGLSLLVLPNHAIAAGWMRLLNLVVTPTLAGLSMAAMGAWRVRRGERVLRIDRFTYAYLFALGLAFIRFEFAS